MYNLLKQETIGYYLDRKSSSVFTISLSLHLFYIGTLAMIHTFVTLVEKEFCKYTVKFAHRQ